MGLQAEHIKVWLQDVEMEEEQAAHAGHGDKWRIFLRLIQAILGAREHARTDYLGDYHPAT